MDNFHFLLYSHRLRLALIGCSQGLPKLRITILPTKQFRYMVIYFPYEMSLLAASFHEDARTHQSDTRIPYNPESEQINPTRIKDFQSGVLGKRSITVLNAHLFVNAEEYMPTLLDYTNLKKPLLKNVCSVQFLFGLGGSKIHRRNQISPSEIYNHYCNIFLPQF